MNTTAKSLYDIIRYDLKVDDNKAKLLVELFQLSIREIAHQFLSEHQNPIPELKGQMKADMNKLELKSESFKNHSDIKFESLRNTLDIQFERLSNHFDINFYRLKSDMIKCYFATFIIMLILFLCLFLSNSYK